MAYCQNCRQRRCVGCLTGFLGCRCRGYEQSAGNSTLCDVFWLVFLFGTGVYIWFWFYYWILAENSQDLINGYVFEKLGTFFPFYTVMLGLTCATLAYILILFLLLMFHFIVDFQLYMHWIHRVVLVIIMLVSVLATVGLDIMWSDGWRMLHISLMITAPFLHIGGVVLATLASWIVAGQFARRCNRRKKSVVVGVIWLLIYIILMLALYLCPLTIKSPCIVEPADLPPKPLLLAHKGASAIAPENTMIAFEYSADDDVLAFESDVHISYDGVPFVYHDSTFRRTTNINDVFPSLTDVEVCWLNISQIRQLDAGSWFLRDDPYGTVLSLSDDRRKLYSNQTVPTLAEMLRLAMQRNVSVMFDIKTLDKHLCRGHPYEDQYGQIVVNVIHRLNFPDDKMWWLYYKSVNATTSFRFVSANIGQSAESLHRDNAATVNFGYSALMWDRILYYLDNNIWVNMYTIDSRWLYSLYWCMNVTSTTTNKCHDFVHLRSPVWHMAPDVYLAVWVTVDSVSAILVLIFWIVQRYHRTMTYKMTCHSDKEMKKLLSHLN